MPLYEHVKDGEPTERINTEAGSNEDTRLAEAVGKSRRRKDGWRLVDPPAPEVEQADSDGG